jgi:hypothetical protein
MDKITAILDEIDQVKQVDAPIPDELTIPEIAEQVARGKIKLSAQQERVLRELLPYYRPKLSAVGHITNEDLFSVQLDRAIERSARSQGRLIEAKPLPGPEDP